jgi:hypothetical protein
LFDKICRHNAITHRLTQPASPTTTGKIERFHLTLRRELLDGHVPFPSLAAAQAAVDAFVEQYNTERPHQALDADRPVTPAERFTPVPEERRELLPAWLPPTLAAASTSAAADVTGAEEDEEASPTEVPRPGRAGWVVRSSWTGWCRRQGTCSSRGNSSGSARPAPVSWCGSG